MAETIINIVLALLSVVLAYVTYFFDTRRKIQEQVNGKIDLAEETGEVGAEKLAMVVNSLYGIVPAIFKPFLTKAAIEKIVQKAFDKMEEYAQKQVEKKSK